jgi:DNA-binding MarR family transcriptional regulator
VSASAKSGKPRKADVGLERRTAYRFAIISARIMRSQSIADLLRRHGLTVGGWRTLSLIGQYEPLHPSAIAERTSVEPDKVTRSVDRLVKNGFVRRAQYSPDRRKVLLRLTRKGAETYRELEAARRGMEKQLLSVLSESELAAFNMCLDKLDLQSRKMFSGNRSSKAAGG